MKLLGALILFLLAFGLAMSATDEQPRDSHYVDHIRRSGW